MIFFLLVVTATFQPAAPTVGDLITIDFGVPVVLDQSEQYEIVSQKGSVAVIRSFQPNPFPISGRAGEVFFRNMVVPMRSVLAPNDKMEPAPLQPPRPLEYPRAPFIAVASVAVVALLTWLAVWALARRTAAATAAVPALPPAERFRAAVESLRRNPRTPQRWARLADETRVFLATLDPELGTELTTTELLGRLYGAPPPPAGPLGGSAENAAEGGGAPLERDSAATITSILRQGDLEKFSPWGPSQRDFDTTASAALLLIPVEEEAKAA